MFQWKKSSKESEINWESNIKWYISHEKHKKNLISCFNCWILSGFGYNYKGEELPNGAYFDEVLEQVVFEDVYSLIQYVVS